MAVVVGFRGDVISCELTRQGVRRGAVEACGSGGVKCKYQARLGKAVGLTSILDRG